MALNHFDVLLAAGGADGPWLVKLVSLIVLPFAHEDLAIITGAFFIVNHLMPAGLVALSIYGGIVGSDFALYGIGAAAREIPWLRRLAISDKVQGFGERLKRNLFAIVALCRVVPGVVFIAFVACGWARVPLRRFTAASLAVSALYLPLMLYLAIAFGDAMDDHLGMWTWPILFGLISATGLVRKRVFTFRAEDIPAPAVPASGSARLWHPAQPRRRRPARAVANSGRR